MDVILLVLERGHIEVEHYRHRLNINAARQQVRGNENTGRARTEIAHALLADGLRHGLTVNHGYGEAAIRQSTVETLCALLRITEHDGRRNRERLEDITEAVHLPRLIVQRDVVLLDAVQLDLRRLERDADGVTENLLRELLYLRRHRRREEGDAAGLWQTDLHDLIDLIREAVAEHLIRLIQNEHAEIRESEIAAVGEVKDATGRADNDLGTGANLTGVVMTGNTADREHHVNLHVAAEGANNGRNLLRELVSVGHDEGLGGLLGGVNAAQETDAEGAGLACTGLCLTEYIATLDEGHDGNGLNGGWLLEAVGVNAAKEILGQPHIIEAGARRELGLIGSFNYKVCRHRTWLV